jgi:hypothetical protein
MKEQEENLKKLEKFFDLDMKVKQEMVDMAPNVINEYDEDAIIKYVDNVFRSLDKIKYCFEEMNLYLNVDIEAKEYINNLFNYYKETLANAGTDITKIKQFYEMCISNMRDDLLKEVKKEFCGYTFHYGPDSILLQSNSINELLHVYHSYVLNNEIMYENIPVIDCKNNNYNYPIGLYGNINAIANNIYNNFPLDLGCGYTDIVSLKDRTLIMIRDLGHALTINIEEENGIIKVNYFIPKLCNIEMINELKGVRKVSADTKMNDGTTGYFETNADNLCNDLFSFMGMVPTDSDMPSFNEMNR